MINLAQNYIEAHLKKMVPLFVLLMVPQGLSASCSSCQTSSDCNEEIQYIEYSPWEAGDDAGLWCLPASRCDYQCPTRPTGSEIYQDVSRLAHKYRYPSERTPDEWRTIMLHMRSILPMTAWDYRMTLAFLQGKHITVEKKPELTKLDTGKNTGSNEIGDTTPNETGSAKSDSLEDVVGPLSAPGEQAMTFGTTGYVGYASKFNHVFTGYLSTDYSGPTSSYFGDFNGNNTFSYTFAPIFLSSYGDNLLLATKIGIYNFGQDTKFLLPYAYVAYFFNDYITLEAGKFLIPFGVYFTHYFPGWIEKSASTPLCRSLYEYFAIAPGADIGFQIKGGIPLCLLTDIDWFKHPSVTYELWIGNGISEVNDFTPYTDLYPNGSICFNVAEANAPNNNNEFTWGGRLAFLPSGLNSFGLSYMQGRWSSNKVSFSADFTGKKLVYRGACFDWNMNICSSIVFRGEYLWTQYEGNLPEYKWVRQTGYWAQLAIGLDLIDWVSHDLYCWKPCLWDSLELVLRSDAVWSQPSGKASLGKFGGGFDYSGFDKKRFCVTLGYYFTQSFTLKGEYAFNYGETALNPLREYITGSSKKTGFAKDVITIRLSYGW